MIHGYFGNYFFFFLGYSRGGRCFSLAVKEQPLKTDKSASTRANAWKALPKLIPSLSCFSAFVFLELIGRWVWWSRVEGGG